MTRKEYMEAKREIRGIEVFNAIYTCFCVAKENPEMDQENVVLQGVLATLYDPDLYESNKTQAETRERIVNEMMDVIEKYRPREEEDDE